MTAIKKAGYLIMIIMALLAGMLLVSCGQEGGAEKDEGVSIEEGWTIRDDGSAYTYAVVIENTTEDKIIRKVNVNVDALDPDGNIIEKKEDYKGAYYMIGPIWPGRKGTFTMPYTEIDDEVFNEWDEMPSGFSIKANVTERTPIESSGADDLEKASPDIEVVSAEEIFNDGETAEYWITLKNNGKYDCEADFTGANSAIPDLSVIFRNEDGEITGSGIPLIEMEGDILAISAGEEVSVDVNIFNMPPGEPEFCFSWQ